MAWKAGAAVLELLLCPCLSVLEVHVHDLCHVLVICLSECCHSWASVVDGEVTEPSVAGNCFSKTVPMRDLASPNSGHSWLPVLGFVEADEHTYGPSQSAMVDCSKRSHCVSVADDN